MPASELPSNPFQTAFLEMFSKYIKTFSNQQWTLPFDTVQPLFSDDFVPLFFKDSVK